MSTASETDERMPNRDSQKNKQTAKNVLHFASSNPAPTRINADDQTKWKMCCYPIIFIVILIILSLVSSLALPNALMHVNPNQWKEGNIIKYCNTHLQLENKIVKCSQSNAKYTKIGSYVTDMVPLNQFLVLYLSIDKRYYHDKNINLNEDVQFQLYSAQTSNGQIVVTNQMVTKNLSLVGPIKDVFGDGKMFILYMSKLHSNQQFYWQLQFNNNSQLAPSTYFLQSQIVNAQFSLFTIILRVTLFVISLGVFLKFNHLISKMPKEKVSIEQRTIQVFSVITLTFNDQLYFISVISPNPFSSFLSSFFLWNFVIYLFIIWVVFLNRIIKNQPQSTTQLFTPARIIVMSIFYVIVLAYSVMYSVAQTQNHPIFSYEDARSNSIVAIQVFAFLVFIYACVYIIYLFIRVCNQAQDRLHRHNIFMAFTIIFFISTATFFFVGGYNLFNYSASQIFFTLCFMNMYSFYLQYFYAPTFNQIQRFLRESKTMRHRPMVQAEQLIQIPQSGQVQICLIQTSQKDQKISSQQNSHKNQSQQSKQQGSLSARQRRRRNRRIKLAKQNQSNNNQKGESNSRIVNQEFEQQKDQFNDL